MFTDLYMAFIHLYAGRIDRVVKLVFMCWMVGALMDGLAGELTLQSLALGLLAQLALVGLALHLKLRDQARGKKHPRNFDEL